MKKLSQIAAVATLGFAALASTTAQAGSANVNFDVVITLTAGCLITAPSNVAIAYTAFASAPTSNTGGTAGSIRCTSGLPYWFSYNAVQAAGPSGTASGTGVNTGLAYTIGAPTGVGAAGPGTGAAQAFAVPVSLTGLPAAGTCTTGTCSDTITTTIYVNY
jgi:hypothetical protein